uniref:Uncharacterized protein n=1 Tax=Oryza sativa subsp. japonica TaxID=39947 RepID=Q67V86_ORYSJ|nr:hypothetical protein [Oryza sativa Japonica Group]
MAKSGFSSGDAERGLRGRGGGRERTSARVRGTGGDSAAVADGDGNRHRGVAGKGGGSLYEGRKGLERLRECESLPSTTRRDVFRCSAAAALTGGDARLDGVNCPDARGPCALTTAAGATPPEWAERRPAVSVDYDRGQREARAEVEGVGAVAFPARHRLRVEGSRWQRDWKVLEAAARVLAIPRAEAGAVDAVLNCWAGRFARGNFPLLIRVRASSHALKYFMN